MYEGIGVRVVWMLQGMGPCGRVWGPVAGVDVCGRGSVLWHRRAPVERVGPCGRGSGMW